ncbi:DUF916 domain-containing protein [Lapidilactobacillus wuchangensis]|uniref:DUF916 domain-containing protein n=1 Tax=Lapidilactobacillus wuchangensis TaxID=2486001 RepID=UPI000F7943B8|nr:DUF916 domain-containing protein [Lapidilactobacillus wuchangensis]
MDDCSGRLDLVISSSTTLKKFRLFIIAVLGLLLVCFAHSGTAVAATTNFMIRPELPSDNLVQPGQGYFSVKLAPKQSRDLVVKVYNPSAEELTLTVRLLNAMTTDQGQIAYVNAGQINQQDLKVPGSQLVEYPRTLVLAPHQTRDLRLKVAAQDQLFRGTKAMALRITSQGDSQAAVNNQIEYLLGVLLTGRQVKQLQQIQIKQSTQQVRLRQPRLQLVLRNPDPVLLKSVQTELTLQHQQLRFLTFKQTKEKLKIAPNSRFKLAFDFPGQKLTPGIYRMKFVIKNSRYRQQTQRYLKIDRHGKVQMLTSSEYQHLQQQWHWLLAIMTLIIVGFINLFIYRKTRKRKQKGSLTNETFD